MLCRIRQELMLSVLKGKGNEIEGVDSYARGWVIAVKPIVQSDVHHACLLEVIW